MRAQLGNYFTLPKFKTKKSPNVKTIPVFRGSIVSSVSSHVNMYVSRSLNVLSGLIVAGMYTYNFAPALLSLLRSLYEQDCGDADQRLPSLCHLARNSKLFAPDEWQIKSTYMSSRD